MISRDVLLGAVQSGRPFLVYVCKAYGAKHKGDVISAHRSLSGAMRKQGPRGGIWQIADAARLLGVAA